MIWDAIAIILWRHWNAASGTTLDTVMFMQSQICQHYSDVIMGTIASQITSFAIVYSTSYSGAYQRKHQSSASLAFVRGIHRWPVNSPHKWPVTQKMLPFDDVIMKVTELTDIFSTLVNSKSGIERMLVHPVSLCQSNILLNQVSWEIKWNHMTICN